MRTKFFVSTVIAVMAMLASVSGPASETDGDELVVFTWSDYIAPEVVAQFEAATGSRVRFVYYESDDLRTRTMAKTGGRGFDVILVNGLSVSAYRRQGWIAPISELSLPNLALLDPRWRRAFPDTEAYGVPYLWGTLGIAYRKDLVSKPINSWRDLFQPEEELRGRIVMIR